MIPGAHTIQMLIDGNLYYWSGLVVIILFVGALVWSELKPK